MAGRANKHGPVHHLASTDLLAVDTVDQEKGFRQQAHHLLSAPMEEMGNSPKDTTDVEQQALVRAEDTEMGIPRPASPVENGVTSTVTASKGSNLNHDLKVSLGLITISMVLLINTLFLHGPTAELHLLLKLSAFFAFTAFLFAICLMFHSFKLMTIKPARLITKIQLRISKILFAISAASLFLTCILLTYSLLPKPYYFLPLVLIPLLLFGGFHLLYRPKTEHGETAPEELRACKKNLKRATQLTLSLVSTSFSGFVGVLLGIFHKAASLGAAYSYVKVSVYLLLGGGLAGIVALLLCRMLLSGNDDHHRRPGALTWQRAILATSNIVMLAMLASAVLMIAETILHGLLAAAAAFPVIAAASVWLLVEFCTEAAEDGSKAAYGTMYAIAVAVASLSFGAILAVFGGLLGGAVGKEQLKACTFLLVSSFVASASLGALTSGTAGQAEKTKASTELAANVLACFGLGTLVLAALALCYQIGA